MNKNYIVISLKIPKIPLTSLVAQYHATFLPIKDCFTLQARIHCINFSCGDEWLCCSSDKGTVHIFALQVGCCAYHVICKRLELWLFSFWLWSSWTSLFVVVLLIFRQRHCSPSTHQHSERPRDHFYAAYGCDQWSCLRRDTIQDIITQKMHQE